MSETIEVNKADMLYAVEALLVAMPILAHYGKGGGRRRGDDQAWGAYSHAFSALHRLNVLMSPVDCGLQASRGLE